MHARYVLRNSKSHLKQKIIMKKNEMKIYQTPEVEIMALKMECVLCQSQQGTEDVEEGWGVELV